LVKTRIRVAFKEKPGMKKYSWGHYKPTIQNLVHAILVQSESTYLNGDITSLWQDKFSSTYWMCPLPAFKLFNILSRDILILVENRNFLCSRWLPLGQNNDNNHFPIQAQNNGSSEAISIFSSNIK